MVNVVGLDLSLISSRVRMTRDAAGGCTYAALADEYGVSLSTIGVIVTRKRWRHV